MNDGGLKLNLNLTLGGASLARPVVSAPKPAGVPVPEPMARPTQVNVDAGDRRVAVLAQLANPRIILFGDLLSADECAALIDLARPKLERSRVVDPVTGRYEDHDARTSEGTYFYVEENPLVATIDRRIATLMGWPIENGEGLQILHYTPGGEYQAHHDYLDPSVPNVTATGGNRVATLIVYLEQPEEGGWTRFPDVGFEIAPQQGNALFFSYDRPSPDTRTLHAGLPVIAGEKWIATRWVRERPYR